jgi:hypothetical protein
MHARVTPSCLGRWKMRRSVTFSVFESQALYVHGGNETSSLVVCVGRLSPG